MNTRWFARKQAFSYPAKDIHWSTKKGELNFDLLVCRLFKVLKFEDRLDIFLVEFLDPELFFMKQFVKFMR